MGTASSQHRVCSSSSPKGPHKNKYENSNLLPPRGSKNKVRNSSMAITDVSDTEIAESIIVPSQSPPPKLSEGEKELLTTTWAQVENDADRIGAVTFINLFEKHPGVKDKFIPFKSIDVNNEHYNRILRNHGLRVLKTVGKMIHRVNEEEHKMINIVRDTGTRHKAYHAEATLIKTMCPHFIKAIEGTLGEKWTVDVKTAYEHLFAILSFHMTESLLIAQKTK